MNVYVDREWMWKSLLSCVAASVAFVSRTFAFFLLFFVFGAHWVLSCFVQFDGWIAHTSRVPVIFFCSTHPNQHELLALLTHWMRDSHYYSVSIVFTFFFSQYLFCYSHYIVTASHLVFSSCCSLSLSLPLFAVASSATAEDAPLFHWNDNNNYKLHKLFYFNRLE